METHVTTHNAPHLSSVAEHIVATPDVCGGKPRIAGHRIRVQDIAILHENYGYAPDEILNYYPTIDLADIHAALTYYYDHGDAIRRDIADDDAFAETFKRQHPEKIFPPIIMQ